MSRRPPLENASELDLNVELGCGQFKRPGFVGIDNQALPEVDIVMDVSREPLPFESNSVDYVYSNHAFEHLESYQHVLQEIVRVCRHMATVEIWTPYGKSNDGFLFGHSVFFTETHFKHICFEYDRFYLGALEGYFDWYRSQYNLYPDILSQLQALKIPLEFALNHMFNIAMEWGVFLHVKKDKPRAPGPQYPERVYSYGRDQYVSAC